MPGGVSEAWTNLSTLSATLVRNNFTHAVIVHLVRRAVESRDRGAEKCSTCEGSRHEICALREKEKLFLEIGILRATRGVTVDSVARSEQLLFSPLSCIYIYYAQLPPLKSIKSLLIEFPSLNRQFQFEETEFRR